MKKTAYLLSFTAMAALSSFAKAEMHVSINRDTVIPVIFEDTLRLDSTRRGDHFIAKVDDGLAFPWGTRLSGHVVSVRQAQDNRPGTMDLQFDEALLPNGEHQKVDAIPIFLRKDNVRRGRDGRLVVVRDEYKGSQDVLVGAIGGLILGSIFKKQTEGVILGTIAGVLAAENDRKRSEVVVEKGQKMGAVFNKRVDFIWNEDTRPSRDSDDRRRDETRTDDRRKEVEKPTQIVVRYQDKVIRYESKEASYFEGEIAMIAMESTAKQMGVEAEKGRGNQWYLTTDAGTLRIEVGSKDAKWNGKPISLSETVVEKNGVIYLPADAFNNLRKENFVIERNHREN